MAVRDDRSDVKQTTAGFRGPLMVQSLTSAKSKFLSLIKEPEELVYLFLSIAIGLGYGAGYLVITTILATSLLLIIYFGLVKRKIIKTNEYNLVIDWKDVNIKFDALITLISEYTDTVKLIRLDSNKNTNSTVLLITPNENTSIDKLMNELRLKDESINISFFEAKTSW
jgi:uncharacterized membrane protein YhiD involved in acid resistance